MSSKRFSQEKQQAFAGSIKITYSPGTWPCDKIKKLEASGFRKFSDQTIAWTDER